MAVVVVVVVVVMFAVTEFKNNAVNPNSRNDCSISQHLYVLLEYFSWTPYNQCNSLST